MGGFKGQVSCPKGPPHLALNPPKVFCFFCFCFLCFPFFVFNRKHSFPPKYGRFGLFICVSLCFSLAFFGRPLVFPFSFFVSLLFFSFFLRSCFSFLFLVLAFSFCVFAFSFKLFFCFSFFSACCFVLNHKI